MGFCHSHLLFTPVKVKCDRYVSEICQVEREISHFIIPVLNYTKPIVKISQAGEFNDQIVYEDL